MIGKIKKGSGFKGCVNYVLGKEQAVLLHADGVLTESRGDIIRSFCMQTGMNPDLKKPVGHIALSYSAVDAPKLTDEKMVQLAQEYMREMKITDTQYIIVRHQDREHPHVHIVFNRIDNNGKTISDRNDMYRNEQVCKKLKTKHGLYFAGGKEQVKQHRLKEPDKSKYEIYTAVKNEIGKSKNWRQLQERLAEKGITVRFKYKGQTSEIQGVSFSKGEYTFKGSEIDRNFSFSKLDKCFGDAGLNTVGNQRQTAFTPVREPLPTQGKTDSPLITGSLGLFTASSPPADEEPNLNLRKKKKKEKNNLICKHMEKNLILEGLLSMVTELKEKQEAQVTPASREETLERLNAIEQVLSELHSNPAIPEKDLQAIQSQLDEIRNGMQSQQKHIEDTKKIVLETYRCFKVMLDTLGSCKTDKEEAAPLPLYQRIYNKVASWIRPGLFLFSAVLVICSVSIFLNIRLAERMQQLQDNDMKYRYLLMQGQADGETFDILENKFKWQRDNGFIRSLTDSVMDFEYRIQKQAEALERARLLNEQAEQLKKEADKLGKP